MNDTDILATLAILQEEVRVLRAEADIRRLIARYMFLCDVPLPERDASEAARFREIVDLYTDDAVWEGIGPYYENQFGRSVGRAQITKHFERFFEPREPKMILNCHYLTSEQIHVSGDTAEGQWVHFQPWIFADGSSVLRSSRLNNAFRCVNSVWKMSRYRTENVFVAPLPAGWATNIPEASRVMHVAPSA
jgi:ketosteroid isomerase-like protein